MEGVLDAPRVGLVLADQICHQETCWPRRRLISKSRNGPRDCEGQGSPGSESQCVHLLHAIHRHLLQVVCQRAVVIRSRNRDAAVDRILIKYSVSCLIAMAPREYMITTECRSACGSLADTALAFDYIASSPRLACTTIIHSQGTHDSVSERPLPVANALRGVPQWLERHGVRSLMDFDKQNRRRRAGRCRERAPSRSAARNAAEGVPYRHITDFVCQNPSECYLRDAALHQHEKPSAVGGVLFDRGSFLHWECGGVFPRGLRQRRGKRQRAASRQRERLAF